MKYAAVKRTAVFLLDANRGKKEPELWTEYYEPERTAIIRQEVQDDSLGQARGNVATSRQFAAFATTLLRQCLLCVAIVNEMVFQMMTIAEEEAQNLDPRFSRLTNENHLNLVIIMRSFPTVWKKFSASLNELDFNDTGPYNPQAVEPIVSANDLTVKLKVYEDLRRDSLAGIRKISVWTKTAFDTVEIMLPGISILLDPALLAFCICSTLPERESANAIAHPSIATIQRSLDGLPGASRAQFPQQPSVSLPALRTWKQPPPKSGMSDKDE